MHPKLNPFKLSLPWTFCLQPSPSPQQQPLMNSGLPVKPDVIPQLTICSAFAYLCAPPKPFICSHSHSLSGVLLLQVYPSSLPFLSPSLSLRVRHICLASRGSDLVPLRMMTLPEGLAGHCLTVIHLLQLWGEGRIEGWRKKRKKKGEVKEQSNREKLEGKRNHRLLWSPSLTRPTLQDIFDSSVLPLKLLSFLWSFSGSPPFQFPTRQDVS